MMRCVVRVIFFLKGKYITSASNLRHVSLPLSSINKLPSHSYDVEKLSSLNVRHIKRRGADRQLQVQNLLRLNLIL